jgi:hypothetical protein
MTDRDTFLSIARWCEAAEGPDRELDAEIMRLFTNSVESDDGDWWYGPHDEMPRKVPAFTASIDAALTLVPEGWKWSLHSADDHSVPCAYCVPNMGRLPWPEWVTDILATSPALALCAAALRARAEPPA